MQLKNLASEEELKKWAESQGSCREFKDGKVDDRFPVLINEDGNPVYINEDLVLKKKFSPDEIMRWYWLQDQRIEAKKISDSDEIKKVELELKSLGAKF